VNKQRSRRIHMERYNLKTLNEIQGKEKYGNELNTCITTCFGLNPSHHEVLSYTQYQMQAIIKNSNGSVESVSIYRIQNTKCKLLLRIPTDPLNLCQFGILYTITPDDSLDLSRNML
jgi:hypothetical protein